MSAKPDNDKEWGFMRRTRKSKKHNFSTKQKPTILILTVHQMNGQKKEKFDANLPK